MIAKPAVHKHKLLILSGIVWSATGIFLNFLATRWFPELAETQIYMAIGGGIVLGAVIAWFGFNKVALKNIRRILDYDKHVCVFAFQEWKSYILIAFMMSLGIFMRTSGLIPKTLLAPMYVGIGTALFLSSFLYYIHYKKNA